MDFVKVRYLKDDKPRGKAYAFKTEENLMPGDIVDIDIKTGIVVDEPVDMEWVESYGAENLRSVKKHEEEVFDRFKADTAQGNYCKKIGAPFFAPNGGVCWNCHQNIYSAQGGNGKKGISVQRAGSELITGCPFCHWSYCE